MKFLIVSFLLLLTTTAHAQLTLPEPCRPTADDFKNWYDHKTFITDLNGGILNGMLLENEIFGKSELNEKLSNVTDANELFKRSDRRIFTALGTNIIGSSLMGGGLVGINFAETTSEKQITYAVIGTGAALALLADYQMTLRKEGINHAFFNYNRQVLAKSLVQNSTGTMCYNEFLKTYDENVIFRSRYNTYTRNGKRHGIGFGGNRLKTLMLESPSAVEQMKKYEEKKLLFQALNVGFVAMSVSGLMLAFQSQKLGSRQDRMGFGLLLGGTLGSVFSNSINRKAEKHINQAVWYYNRDVLLRQSISSNMDIK